MENRSAGFKAGNRGIVDVKVAMRSAVGDTCAAHRLRMNLGWIYSSSMQSTGALPVERVSVIMIAVCLGMIILAIRKGLGAVCCWIPIGFAGIFAICRWQAFGGPRPDFSTHLSGWFA